MQNAKLFCTKCNGTHDHIFTLNQEWRCSNCGVLKQASIAARLRLSLASPTYDTGLPTSTIEHAEKEESRLKSGYSR